MAVKNVVPPSEIVKQSNELARAKDDVNSPTASRVLAGLIAQVDSNDPQLKRAYSFPIAMLTNMSPRGGSKRARIRAAIDELSKCRVWLEEKGKISAIPFFTIITYADGIISGEFNEKIAPYLLGLTGYFTQFSLSEYFELPSTYSQKMFKLLKSWSKGFHKEFIEISLKELQDYLHTPTSLNAVYSDFKKRVLIKSQSDINNKTSIQFEWDPVKTGRTVTAIRFRIKAKRNRKTDDVALPAVSITQQTLLTIDNQQKEKETNIAQVCALSLRGECQKKTCINWTMCETVFLPQARACAKK